MSEQSKSDAGTGKHPKIETIEDALTFRIARFAAINAYDGGHLFRAAFQLTMNEVRLLGLIGAHQPVTFAWIAKRLYMDKGQLSRLVRAIQERGLIGSAPNAEDARQLNLSLTEAGTALHERLINTLQSANEEVVDPLSEREVATFLDLMDRLLEHNERLVRRHF